jgi:hypothetical protein
MRKAVQRAFHNRTDKLKIYTVVGLVDLDANGAVVPRLVVAGIVEGSVVAIDEELSGDGQSRRFCHQVRARSIEAAEAESRAYLTYLHSLLVDPA